MPICRILRLLCLLSLVTAVCRAQIPTGIQPLGTMISKGADVINVGNNNVYLNIPIISKQGRGAPFTYSISLNSSIWAPVRSGSSTSWLPVSFDGSALGWQGLNPQSSTGASYTETVSTQSCQNTNNEAFFTEYVFMPALYLNSTSSFHSLNDSHIPLIYFVVPPGSNANCPPNGPVNQTFVNFTTSDGSGYSGTMSFASTTGSNPSVVFQMKDAQGHTFTPAANASQGGYSGPQTITDANGNQVAENGGQYTDTTGSKVLSVAYLSGTQPAKTSLQYNLPANESEQVIVVYETATVATNFGCGIGEYGPVSTTLVSQVQTPIGNYSFSYEPTPGSSTSTTGRVASVRLPTGGTISYVYSGGSNGISCSDGSTPTLTRTTSDGISTYAIKTYTSTVTDEKNNQTVYTLRPVQTSQANPSFLSMYETHRKVYQGSASGTPLEEVVTCYDGTSSNCDQQSISSPVTEIDTTSSFNGGSQSTTKTSYDSTGVVATNMAQYSGSTLLAATANVYTISPPLYELKSSTVTDGSGNTVAYSSFGYDETTPTATSNITQHAVAPNASARGNQTSTHTSIDGTISNTLNTVTAYYDTGQPVSTTTPNGMTAYTYDPTQTYVQGTTMPTPSSGVVLATSAVYDVASGVMTSATGMNANQTMNYTEYDGSLRPTTMTTPEGGQITAAYFSYGTSAKVLMNTNNNTTQSSDQETLFDGYGRTTRVAVAAGNSTWYVTDSCYDAAGLLQYQSVAYSSSSQNPSGNHCSSSTATRYTYDALGRVTQTATPDGNTVSNTYNSRALQIADANGTTRILQYDLLGRLSGVCEVVAAGTAVAGGDTSSACAIPGGSFDIAGSGFSTSYAYNLAGHSTTVTQGAQTRTFQTDAAGRTTSTTEPESGTTTYTYAYNSTGLQVVRTRSAPNQTSASVTAATTTQYDSVGRVVSISYQDSANSNTPTSTKTFVYDQASASNANYNTGQLTSLSNANQSRSYTYDLMGRVLQTSECLPGHGCSGNAPVAHTFYYDLASNLIQVNTLRYQYNPAGQLINVSGGDSTDNRGTQLNVMAQSPGGPVTTQYANVLTVSSGYDSMNRQTSQSLGYNSTILYTNSVQQVGGRVQSVSDSMLNRSTNFSYDPLGNLSGSSGSNGLGFSAAYDRYGNRWSQAISNPPSGSAANPSFSFNLANNHVQGFSYDAAGNLTADGSHTYTYDDDNNLIAIDHGSTASYLFDALNERVQVTAGGTTTAYGFDPQGRRTVAWTLGEVVWAKEQYYAGAQPFAYLDYDDDDALHFQYQDMLGSERLRTDDAGDIESTFASLPFGEMNQTTGSDNNPGHFAQLDQDGVASLGLSHAMYRDLSNVQGRWLSPDPYMGSYDQSNPKSFNRYAYVMNNPLNLTDPSGLDYTICTTPQGPNSQQAAGYQYTAAPPSCYTYTDGEWQYLFSQGYGSGSGPGQGQSGNYYCASGAFCASITYTTPSFNGSASGPPGGWQPIGYSGPTGSAGAPSGIPAPSKPAPPPLTPQQQHAQQQEMLNRKCFAANAVSNTLWITSGLNALGAVGAGLSGVGAPLVPILGGISAVEAIGAGGYGLYASFVCYQATQ